MAAAVVAAAGSLGRLRPPDVRFSGFLRRDHSIAVRRARSSTPISMVRILLVIVSYTITVGVAVGIEKGRHSFGGSDEPGGVAAA